MNRPLEGLYLPVATPRIDGRPAANRLQENLQKYLQLPIAGFLLCGSSAEAPLLRAEEKRALIRAARAIIPSDRTLMVGVGHESTAGTTRQIAEAEEYGADIHLVLPPHFYPLPAEAVTKHFETLARNSHRPLVLYHVTKFTGRTLPLESLRRICLQGNIPGIKESTTDPGVLDSTLALASPQFSVLCGNAAFLQRALTGGARGAILAVANILPEPCLKLSQSLAEGDFALARHLQRGLSEFSERVLGTYGLAGMKYVMERRGLHGGDVAEPLPSIDDDARRALDEALDDAQRQQLISRRALT